MKFNTDPKISGSYSSYGFIWTFQLVSNFMFIEFMISHFIFTSSWTSRIWIHRFMSFPYDIHGFIWTFIWAVWTKKFMSCMNLQLWFCIVQATVTGADPKVKVQENPVDLCSWIFVYIEGIHLLLIYLLPLHRKLTKTMKLGNTFNTIFKLKYLTFAFLLRNLPYPRRFPQSQKINNSEIYCYHFEFSPEI